MRPGQLTFDDAIEILVDDVGLSAATASRILVRLRAAGAWLTRSPQHGTRACYNNGWPPGEERPGVAGPGCRCDPCRDANAEYTRRWRASAADHVVPSTLGGTDG